MALLLARGSCTRENSKSNAKNAQFVTFVSDEQLPKYLTSYNDIVGEKYKIILLIHFLHRNNSYFCASWCLLARL